NVAPASAPPASASEASGPEAEASAGEPLAPGPEGTESEVSKAEAGSPGGSELAALESSMSESAVPRPTASVQPTDASDSSPKGTAIVALEPAALTGGAGPVAPEGSTAAPAPAANGG